MLASQRAAFDLPRDVGYFNAAGTGLLPLAVQDAARLAVGRKGQPWLLDAAFAEQQNERARKAAAALIGAEPDDVALVSSVGYGVAIAGKILNIAAGTRVLVLENDHTSPVLEWMVRAPLQGFAVETVRQPADGDWTSAVLEAIARPGAAPVSLASISSVHWADGGMVDMMAVKRALASHDGLLLVDATQSVGMLPNDVTALDPDILVFPTYKWVLGPYGRAFVYIAKRHQGGLPLEQTAFGRIDVRAENEVYFADTRYLPSARRFDMGERDHFISMEMAAIGMELVADWGVGAIAARVRTITDEIAEALAGTGAAMLPRDRRAPHLLSLRFPGNARAIAQKLAAQKLYVMPRLGRVRVSPHVYNDEEDVARLVSALREMAA
jgi:selenocysteine lyase/cysteine desulfurase